MEKNELSQKYELVVILDAKLKEEDKELICKDVASVITKEGGKVINSQVWLEKQKFTFEIKKCNEGTYYLINYEAPGYVNAKVRPVLKLNERILRFAMAKVESRQTAEAVKS